MHIEHMAINVADPVALADWWTKHLEMRVVRRVDEPPHTRFIADSTGQVILEIYQQNAPVPDYRNMDPMVLHIAFVVADVAAAADKLAAAGASRVSASVAPNGDQLAFLRDPWGVTIQLVKRAAPMR